MVVAGGVEGEFAEECAGDGVDVRWARLTGGGRALSIIGAPHFAFTVRPWPSEVLDAAKHPADLVEHDRLYINVDAALHGIGTASCGPGVLPQHRLQPAPLTFTLGLQAIAR